MALTAGGYVDFLLAAGYLIAVFALMIPLSKNEYWGALLAHFGAVILAFLFCGFAIVKILPFACFFGIHPLLNRLQKNYVKKMPYHAICFFGLHPLLNRLQKNCVKGKLYHGLCFLGKAVWFDLDLLVAWFTLAPLLGFDSATWYPWVAQYQYYVIFLGGTVVFAVYDWLIFMCQRSVDLAIKRIRR